MSTIIFIKIQVFLWFLGTLRREIDFLEGDVIYSKAKERFGVFEAGESAEKTQKEGRYI